jgi:hypothetical protein
MNYLEQQARQERLDALYEADGRHDPKHSMHALYTGLKCVCYALVHGEYEDYGVASIYLSKTLAEQDLASMDKKFATDYSFRIEEFRLICAGNDSASREVNNDR